MTPTHRSITARQLVSALGRDGWSWDHSDGSHRFYAKGYRTVAVPYHRSGATFPPKTLSRILAGTGCPKDSPMSTASGLGVRERTGLLRRTDEDLRRLRLLK